MDGTRRVRDVDDDVADLTQAVRTFVEAQELRNHGSGLGTEFSRGYMSGERGVVGVVFEKGPEEVDVEQLEEHTARH